MKMGQGYQHHMIVSLEFILMQSFKHLTQLISSSVLSNSTLIALYFNTELVVLTVLEYVTVT